MYEQIKLNMERFTTIILSAFLCLFLDASTGGKSMGVLPEPRIVTRQEWGARPPKYIQNLSNPVPYVVVHHSYIPSACYNLQDCEKAMRWMQDLHQINNSWADIGYNFAVGSDGNVYEGRGWTRVGAHAPVYNFKSIGVCLIGDWRAELPPERQLTAAKELIAKGVREGYIKENYELVGHRQVRTGTECPGDRLYKEISEWPNYCPRPEDDEEDNNVDK